MPVDGGYGQELQSELWAGPKCVNAQFFMQHGIDYLVTFNVSS